MAATKKTSSGVELDGREQRLRLERLAVRVEHLLDLAETRRREIRAYRAGGTANPTATSQTEVDEKGVELMGRAQDKIMLEIARLTDALDQLASVVNA